MEQKNRNKVETLATHTQIQEWISKGKTRQFIFDKLMNEYGMAFGGATALYYGALKELTLEPDMVGDYKKNVIQQNLDRLEKIVEDGISGSTADKALALKAIDQLNKMCGAYSDNNITIAQQNKDGEGQIIQIRFGE